MDNDVNINTNPKEINPAMMACWGLGGAILSQVGNLMGRRVVPLSQKLDDKLPESAYSTIKIISNLLKDVVSKFRPSETRISDHTYSNFIAPITEEVIFRLILQEGASLALQSFFPASIAKVFAVTMVSFLFGIAHNPDLRHEQFVSTALQGFAFGITQEMGGTLSAILVSIPIS